MLTILLKLLGSCLATNQSRNLILALGEQQIDNLTANVAGADDKDFGNHCAEVVLVVAVHSIDDAIAKCQFLQRNLLYLYFFVLAFIEKSYDVVCRKSWYPSFVSLVALLMRTYPIWQCGTIQASRSAATHDAEKFAAQGSCWICFTKCRATLQILQPT